MGLARYNSSSKSWENAGWGDDKAVKAGMEAIVVIAVARWRTLFKKARRDEDEFNEQLIVSSHDDHAIRMMKVGNGGSMMVGGGVSWCISASTRITFGGRRGEEGFPPKMRCSRQIGRVLDRRRRIVFVRNVGNSNVQ